MQEKCNGNREKKIQLWKVEKLCNNKHVRVDKKSKITRIESVGLGGAEMDTKEGYVVRITVVRREERWKGRNMILREECKGVKKVVQGRKK